MAHPSYVILLRRTALTLGVVLTLSACDDGSGGGTPGFPNVSSTTINGTVSSGAQPAVPISGATVSLYRAQAGAPDLIAQAVTDGNGQFVVPLPNANGDDVFYAVARKTGAIELAAVISPAIPSTLIINELTTVATAYAMAQFLDNGVIVGPGLSLKIAAGMADNLVTSATGTTSPVIRSSPNGDETNTQRELATLANILAACTQNYPNACAALFALTPSSGGAASTTIFEAIANIARNPAAHVAPLFALGDALHTFAPSLTAEQGPLSATPLQKLEAWTVAVKVNGTGSTACPFGGPANIAFDAQGYAWITNNVVQGTPNSANCMVVLRPDGRPADGAGGTVVSPVFGGGIKGQGFGVTVDTRGHIWAGNFGWGTCPDCIPTGSVSEFTATGIPLSPAAGYVGGTDRIQGTVSDQRNNIWMASYENNAVVVFPNGNPSSSFPLFIDGSVHPFDIAIDDDGSGWVSYTGSSVVSKFTLGANALVRQFTSALDADSNPKGIALDSQGTLWVAAGKQSAVYAFTDSGRRLGSFTGGGIDGPWGLTVDAGDHVWVANFGRDLNLGTTYNIAELCGGRGCGRGVKAGAPLSPPSGYTLPSGGSPVLLHDGTPLYGAGAPPSYKPLMRLTSVTPDMAGNLWAANNWKPDGLNDLLLNPGGDGIVIFVGLATPTKAPARGRPRLPS